LIEKTITNKTWQYYC